MRITGSSPRAWGTQRNRCRWCLRMRFIPTCVGNTTRAGCRIFLRAVHPHVRGEHRRDTAQLLTHTGSSPRAWGTRWRKVSFMPSHRFIPTCVGNTDRESIETAAQTVHPHVRGEHPRRKRITWPWYGSSPRAWGTRRPQANRPGFGRFIPTCVGNTYKPIITQR